MKKKLLFVLVLGFIIVSNSYSPIYAITDDYSDVISSRIDDIRYRYKIVDGKLYKRLYNYSKQEWIGDWIPA